MGLLTFSLNLTLDGCVDHREGIADDETHAFFTRMLDNEGAMLWGAIGKRYARRRARPAGADRRVQVPHPPQDRRPRSDPLPERAHQYAEAGAGFDEAAVERGGCGALQTRGVISSMMRRLVQTVAHPFITQRYPAYSLIHDGPFYIL